MQVKTYNYLPADAKMIREEVFVAEQGFVNEIDDIDEIALHLVMYDENEKPIATCRIFEGTNPSEFILGRLAVVKEYRGMNIGSRMICAAERKALQKGGTALKLHSQCVAKEFYAKSGYTEFGVIEYEEDCPHIWMRKYLTK